ncbi:MAG: hypothetical protein A2543_01510 [Candidatus Komeilibacteria bacterium RIFOXYD2_FULL_37_8]|nr:MAG: hypothetical protein A2611_00975 [Candidatus Komeilibacteria bacterium RIFOXYD1_FULL_37_29]OGY96274.1 MAG: hypothetical protein A2543_01510 [Candidatus Komeilibacteria bacterium RIFOXYD2_FULL_37_8]
MFAKYQDDINFLESLSNIPRQNYMLGQGDRSIYINRMRKFLSLVGSPEKKLKFIHIAGTSGKGTSVKMLERLMNNAGLKTGSYTSPFATTSLEKISIGDKLISAVSLHKILKEKIKPNLDKYLLTFPQDPISYFETWLAIALLYFQEQKCDWVILEAGLGGQHDATNVIVSPKVTAITNIGLDHTEILGNTKEKIARDKAGIIKKNSLFLSSEKNKKLLKIFEGVCKKQQAWFIPLENLAKNYPVKGGYFKTPKQLENLNLTLNILSVLKISPPDTLKIINNFGLICRQEIIRKKPTVVLDGSHNKDKLDNLLKFIGQQKYRHLHLILGFGYHKNYKIALKKLLKISNYVYLTRYLIVAKRSADLRKLYQDSRKINHQLPISVYNDPYQAFTAAFKKATKNDLILITGSFFLAGELRKKWISEEYIVKNRKLDKR